MKFIISVNLFKLHFHQATNPMNSQLSILMVSDQNQLVEQVKQLLSTDLQVVHSPDALEDEYKEALDVLIIDAAKDPDHALELSSRLRQVQPTAGIVCITKANDPSARLKALAQGADHALTLPLEPLELQAAIQSLDRHMKTPTASVNQPNSIDINSQRRCIKGSLSEQALTMSEFLLLQALARAKGQQLELWQIYDVLGKNEQTLQKAALEAQISRLRKKLKDAGAGNQALRSMRLKGYQLCCPIQIS